MRNGVNERADSWHAEIMGNAVVHFELIGPDPARLRAFYGELFGWEAPAGSPVVGRVSAPNEYSFIPPDAGAPPAAGGIGGGPGFDSHVVFYVGVEDVREALAKADRLGAAVVMPPQRNEEGQVTVGHFRDPAGNLVGVAGPV
jgi:predicted enzyme related to lactoylglutathione lyase